MAVQDFLPLVSAHCNKLIQKAGPLLQLRGVWVHKGGQVQLSIDKLDVMTEAAGAAAGGLHAYPGSRDRPSKGGCWSIKQAEILHNTTRQLTGKAEPSVLPAFDPSESLPDNLPPSQRSQGHW